MKSGSSIARSMTAALALLCLVGLAPLGAFVSLHQQSLMLVVGWLVIILGVALVAFVFGWSLYETFFVCSPVLLEPGVPNPLLFGTNINVADTRFISSRRIRRHLQKMHVTSVRIDIADKDAIHFPPEKVKGLKYVKAMCMTPLIILHFPLHLSSDPDQIQAAVDQKNAVNIPIIEQINKIFGDRVVYYEIGNEPDLHPHMDGKMYAQHWNRMLPQLKALARNGRFGGPVFSLARPQDVADFVRDADPRPDFVSWHEYNVQPGDTLEKAIQRMNDVVRNVARTQAALQAVLAATSAAASTNLDDGQSLSSNTHIENCRSDPLRSPGEVEGLVPVLPPIIISEWNYESDIENKKAAEPPDPRATPDFLRKYVSTMFTHFIENGVSAANQFQALDGHPEYQLIDKEGNLSPAGETFRQMYEKYFGASDSSQQC